ncbi:FecR domain-containing protein [Chitinophaga pollutisoli]|uniref:FecR domain-containing protein n=1 Tax=Chitinophaga pollutisoli TaxID=3133966 RepID=A0ABZ2YJB4_9BACT
MNDQQLLQLLDKYLRNDCTPEEQQALESWLERYASPYREAAPPAPRLAAVYDSITARLQAEGEITGASQAPVRRLRWWKPAAAAAILIAAATTFFLTSRQPELLTASAPAGENTFVELPDGSRVWLNARSSLRYPGNMGSGSRTVHLSGEGYFEVAPDQQHPFEIHTEELAVQVLGTSFNLKAYAEDAELETTLVDGKVAVSLRSDPSRRQLLAPGQKLLLTRKTTAGATGSDWGDFYAQLQNNTKTKDTIATESLWRKGRLQFRDQSFSELAKTMERWYNKRIVIEDASLNDNRFSGEFRKEDITQALKALQIIATFTYDMRGDTVFIQQ